MSRVLALAALASLLAGCVTGRTITRMEDHPEKNITILETIDTSSYLLYEQAVHQFWQCEQRGAKLVCKPLCGRTADVQCPNIVWGGQTASSNVR